VLGPPAGPGPRVPPRGGGGGGGGEVSVLSAAATFLASSGFLDRSYAAILPGSATVCIPRLHRGFPGIGPFAFPCLPRRL